MKRILLILLLASGKLSSQIIIGPASQLSLYDQSIGVMAGYKIQKLTAALNYQIGHQYKEQSLYVKYEFTNNNAFNIGLSMKGGYVNNHFHVFFPALEQQIVLGKRSVIEVGLRPINGALLVIEPRLIFKL